MTPLLSVGSLGCVELMKNPGAGRILISDTLVLMLGATVCAALPWAWGGVDRTALLWSAIACCLTGPSWALGGWTAKRKLRPFSLAGLALFLVLAALHVVLPAEPARDAYSFAHQSFLERTRSACLMPDDRRLHAAWIFGLGCLLVFCGEVLARRPRALAAAGLPVLASCLGMGAVAVWMQESGWSPWAEFGRTVSQRPFGFLFHDIIATSWLNLVLGLGGLVLCRLGRSSRRSRWIILSVLLSGVIVWLQSRHQSDAGHLLVWVVAGAVNLGVAVSVYGTPGVPATEAPKSGQRRAWTLLLIGVAVIVIGFATDRRETHPIRVVAGVPLHERSTGEDGLIQSDDPLAKEFFGDRRLAWGTGVRMFTASPWVGWGPLGWREHYPRFTADPLLRSFFLYNQFTHNDALQFALEWGLAGLLALALLFAPQGAGLLSALRSTLANPLRPQCDSGTLICTWGAVGALLVHGQIDFPGQIPVVQALAAFLLAGSAAAFSRHSSSTVTASPEARSSGAK